MIPTREEIDKADEDGLQSLCLELCERLGRERPNDASLLYLYAGKLTTFALYDEAEKVLFHAEKFAPRSLLKWILYKRGKVYQKRGDFKRAEELYLKAHFLDPNEAALLIFAAAVVFRSGEIPMAIDLVKRATNCTEGPIYEGYFNLGGYLCAQRRYAEAKDCYLRAIELNPDYENVHQRLEDVERVLATLHSESVDIRLLPSP